MSPLLFLSMVTGVLMLFSPVRNVVIGKEERPQSKFAGVPPINPGQAVLRAKTLFPDAALRRISLSRESGDIVVRMKRPFEWTPQGRTQVTFRADGTASVEDAAAAKRAAWISEKLYPIHSAKVGDVAMRLLMTLSGLGLFVLGSFATWSFWIRRWTKYRKAARRPAARRDFARALR